MPTELNSPPYAVEMALRHLVHLWEEFMELTEEMRNRIITPSKN